MLRGWAGLAQAQPVLGGPIVPDSSPDPVLGRPTLTLVDRNYFPAEIAVAKIKLDEAQIEARRAAVKYLGTIDCRFYPEVEFGLVAALRSDSCESVRYEAAVAIGSISVLTLKMLEALNMAALGIDLDGNPSETSDRVRIAARMSLYRCACRGLCMSPEDPSVLVRDRVESQSPSVVPASYVSRTIVPASQAERDLAATISTKTAAPPASTQRPVYQFLLGFFGRDASRDGRDNVDPRLRGLNVLGSESTVAIPTTPPVFASPRLP